MTGLLLVVTSVVDAGDALRVDATGKIEGEQEAEAAGCRVFVT